MTQYNGETKQRIKNSDDKLGVFGFCVFILGTYVNSGLWAMTFYILDEFSGMNFIENLSNFQYGQWRGFSSAVCAGLAFFFASSMCKHSLTTLQKVSVLSIFLLPLAFMYIYVSYDMPELIKQGALLRGSS